MQYNANLYAHWLDSAYTEIAQRLKPGQDPLAWPEAAMKIHALFGRGFILSDMQAWDSALMARLFNNPGFTKFLGSNEGFLRLVVNPQHLSSPSASQFEIATAGLKRCLKPGWISSVLEDSQPIKELAATIPTDRDLDKESARIRLILEKHSQYADQLRGMVDTIAYFADNDHLRARAGRETIATTYFKVLEKELESRPQNDKVTRQNLANVTTTVNFVKENVDPTQWHMRSLLMSWLSSEQDNIKRQQIWHTAVPAWNHAVGQSLGIERESLAALPHVGPLGFASQTIREVVAPSTSRLLELNRQAWFIDLVKLDWITIERVVSESTDERAKYMATEDSPNREEAFLALEALCNKMAELLTWRIEDKLPAYCVTTQNAPKAAFVWKVLGLLPTIATQSPLPRIFFAFTPWFMSRFIDKWNQRRIYAVAATLHVEARCHDLD